MRIFKLPDLGEGLPDAEIHEWYVKEGDIVQEDQPLVSMETAKAVVDVPSPQAGQILRLHGQVGDTIAVGAVLIEFASTKNTVELSAAEEKKSKPVQSNCDAGATVAGKITVGETILEENAAGLGVDLGTEQKRPQILPALRLLAEKLDLDLSNLAGTGIANTITIDDFAQFLQKHYGSTAQKEQLFEMPTSVEQNVQKIKGVRKAMLQSMALSHQQVAAVSLFDDACITHWPDKTDITLRLVEAIMAACAAEPVLNAWFDPNKQTLLLQKNVNLGLAVDSPEGLFVPVLHDVKQYDAKTLREKINDFKKGVQARSLAPEILKGASITLSNFGTFAGRYATPMIVPPMVAIIGAGRCKVAPGIDPKGNVTPQRYLPLSLTFDHRAATGGEASRFLRVMIDSLES